MNWVDILKTHLANDNQEGFQTAIKTVTKRALIDRGDMTNAEIIRSLLIVNGVNANISHDCDEYINNHPDPASLLGFLIGHEVLHEFYQEKRKK